MKLISCTEFVNKTNEDLRSNILNYNVSFYYGKIVNYANFIKQPLQLDFFVPCDEDGNVLELPTKKNSLNTINHENKMMGYQKAKERVIFEGCKLFGNREECWIVSGNGYAFKVYKYDDIIENLIPYNLTITENAIKKYNL